MLGIGVVRSFGFWRRLLAWLTASVVLAALVFGGTILIVKFGPLWLSSTSGLDGGQASAERGRVRTALLGLIAGTLAAIGAVYTARTFALNRRGQVTDQYLRAVEQLGNKEIDVRIGGIYALERLARDSPGDHATIMDVLAAYVRAHAHVAKDTVGPAGHDIQAVITVLSRRQRRAESRRPIAFDLSATNLRGVRADDLHLRDVRLSFAHLEDVTFPGADLRGANFNGAFFTDATLRGAKLHGANLSTAKDLGKADLAQAEYDQKTKWPEDFKPKDAGAVRRRS